MLGTSWPLVHIAFAKLFSGEQVTDADIRAWVSAKLASGELVAPSDKVQANVSATYYDQSPFGTFPTLFQQVSKGVYIVLPENEWIFRSNRGNGAGKSAKPSNSKVLAAIHVPALAPETVVTSGAISELADTQQLATETNSQV